MDEQHFHSVADRTLFSMLEALEKADESGLIDAECENGALTILIPGGKTLLVSKHTPMKQLWFSSPLSGGLHFSWRPDTSRWQLADGRTLGDTVSHELHVLAKIEVRFQ